MIPLCLWAWLFPLIIFLLLAKYKLKKMGMDDTWYSLRGFNEGSPLQVEGGYVFNKIKNGFIIIVVKIWIINLWCTVIMKLITFWTKRLKLLCVKTVLFHCVALIKHANFKIKYVRCNFPNSRSAYTAPQAAQKADWMDGCYWCQFLYSPHHCA